MTALSMGDIVSSVNRGEQDEHLDLILDAVRNRREVAATRKAINLEPGDEFLITNISPKYLADVRVAFIRHDGNWLQVEIVSPFPGGNYRQGERIKLRHTHVGSVTKRGA